MKDYRLKKVVKETKFKRAGGGGGGGFFLSKQIVCRDNYSQNI